MKIAIPVNEQSMDSGVCQSFGRTPYFLIYDIESNEKEFIDNGAAASQGGAGIKAAQLIVDHNVWGILTPRCGQNAADVLNGAKIKIYKTKNENILDNIKAFIQKELNLLDDIHSGLHNHGGK